jgi:hypothetical protein
MNLISGLEEAAQSDGGRSAQGSQASRAGETVQTNSQAPWDSFDAQEYFSHNYRTLREDDREILEAVRDHFGNHFGLGGTANLAGLDVGAGTNLYPALSMLPWCSTITLFERAPRNVEWLRDEVEEYGANWDEFWQVLTEHPAYRAVDDPRHRLAAAAAVLPGDLFTQLGVATADIGTMFFVAESLSTARDEYRGAIDHFARALRPGAPFAVAFMENSDGYPVGGHKFPAYKVDEPEVIDSLRAYAESDLTVSRIPVPGDPLRAGYTGMLFALGRRRG